MTQDPPQPSQPQARIEFLLQAFEGLQSWDEKYKKIIELGRKLPPFPETHRTDENKVKGCQSQVWLHAELTSQGQVVYQADSDALIVKGLAAILLQIYSGLTPDEILKTPGDFLKALGLDSHLSPSRSNGLYSMLKQIHHYAVAFRFLLKSQK